MDFFFDDVDCLSDIYALESYHYSIVKDNLRIEHMKAVHEDVDIITEAFKDILGKMGEWFKKLITALQEFFKKITMFISSYTTDIDKFCKKYKKELSSKKVNFSVQGYEFNLDTAPDLSELRKIVDSYNDGVSNIEKMNKNDIKMEQTKYLSEDNVDKIRGQVLGRTSSLSDDVFAKEVRKFYHGGEIDTISVNVDDSLFKKVVNEAPKLSASKKDAEKLRDDVIALLSRAEKFFGRNLESVYVGASNERQYKVSNLNYSSDGRKMTVDHENTRNVSTGKKDVLETLIKFKYNQTRVVSSIVNVVVREYANAYKDKVKMYREIIRKSLFGGSSDDSAESGDN